MSDGPIITRDEAGNIKKHWTTEAAEAAAQAERARVAERIRAMRIVRPSFGQRLKSLALRISSLLTPHSSRPKAERL